MNPKIIQPLFTTSIIISTFGVLLQLFLFGRPLFEAVGDAGMVMLACIALLPVLGLLPVFQRWRDFLFVAGNVVAFASGWFLLLMLPNGVEPPSGSAIIGVPLGLFLGGIAIVLGTGIQYVALSLGCPTRSSRRGATAVIGASSCVSFFPLVKIGCGFTSGFAVSCFFSAINLILFRVSLSWRDASQQDWDGSRAPTPRAVKFGTGFSTMLVVVFSLLVTHVSYYLGQNRTYIVERAVWVWPGALAAAGICSILRHFTARSFESVALPTATLACAILVYVGTPWAYSVPHALLVGAVYALSLIVIVEDLPCASPSRPRRAGFFFGIVGLFLLLSTIAVGYIGGIPVRPEELPPIWNALLPSCFALIALGALQNRLVGKISRRSDAK